MDGESFVREAEPLLQAEDKRTSLEDPRIVRIDDTFYLTHTVYDGHFITLQLATSTDLKTWHTQGEMLTNWDFDKAGGFLIDWDMAQFIAEGDPEARRKWAKAGAIFPEKISGNYHMLFGDRHIWRATSDDGLRWQATLEPFIRPRSEQFFDSYHVEMGPPPIRTEQGWLVLYHGINQTARYQLGYVLLDLRDPSKILQRSSEPIFIPSETYELSGIVDILPGGFDAMKTLPDAELEKFVAIQKKEGTMPAVAFFCGAVRESDDRLRLYYGAADSVICTATAAIADILNS